MKKVIIYLILFVLSVNVQAQSFELEKVTKSQLEEKVHAIDTSAVAAILLKKARTIFKYNPKDGFSTKTEFSIKIKIYKKEGLSWANFEIPYYVGYENLNKEYVTIQKAYTYNLENGKVVKQKVSGESKFKEKVNELWQTKIVAFPNVKEGSIIELKYEFVTENLSELPVFQYQYKIPVDYAQYVTEIPGFYLYQAIKSGYVEVTINDKIESASLEYDDNNLHTGTNYLNFQQIHTIYEVANVPALIEENYVSSIDDYYGKIEQELKTIQFPDTPVKQIATSWESVAKSIYEEKEFGGELNKTNYFLNDLKKITDKTDSKVERLKAIYEFVKSKMSWNEKKGYYTRKGIETAYQEATGNVAEINLMLTSMLKMGGLDASPVLLSTRDNGVPMFPSRSKFNYVIASVLLDGKQYLLDATDKFCTINNLPNRDLNDKGRLINKDGSSSEIDLMPTYNSLYNRNVLSKIDSNGELSGQIREQYFDYQALRFREKYSGISKESYLEKEEKTYPGLEIENYELKNDKLIYDPIIETYTFKNKSAVEIIEDKMYFSPMLYFSTKENPFKQDNRQYPVNFSFPSKDKYLIVIDIPEGYKVESLPKSTSIGIDKKYLSFNFSATNTDKQITIAINYEINESVIPSEHYDTLKQFFKVMIEKENEKIILKKN
jgi:transglutaminase-like putative cysteine protease